MSDAISEDYWSSAEEIEREDKLWGKDRLQVIVAKEDVVFRKEVVEVFCLFDFVNVASIADIADAAKQKLRQEYVSIHHGHLKLLTTMPTMSHLEPYSYTKNPLVKLSELEADLVALKVKQNIMHRSCSLHTR